MIKNYGKKIQMNRVVFAEEADVAYNDHIYMEEDETSQELSNDKNRRKNLLINTTNFQKSKNSCCLLF